MSPNRDEQVILVLLIVSLLAGGVWLVYRNASPRRPALVPLTQEPANPASHAAPEPAPELIYVHVAGAVTRPGVYQLFLGSRVFHAVEAAGGGTEAAVLDTINLAALLTDGQRVHVPTREEAAAAAAAQGGKININRADRYQLERLPGIGPALAAEIVNYRTRVGPFSSVDDLVRVSGIGEKTLERIRALVTVD
ncbi:MAG: ComEA family DNA-binding protein [Bacillota bacterium]